MRFVYFAASLLCCLPFLGFSHAAEAGKRPNVLIVTTDQQRVDVMSAVGNKWVKTPNMDSIAARGVYFVNSYCSYPLCSPSRSSLHTGRTPHEIGVNTNTVPIDPAIPISGQVFRAAGYETAYAGKWHMPDTYPSDGIAGYEVLNKTSRQRKLAHDVDESTVNVAIDFLRRKHDKPFLLVCSFINPHDICLLAGEKPLSGEVWNRYKPAPDAVLPPLPSNFGSPVGVPEILKRSHAQWDDNHWRGYCYAYYRLLEDVDRQVGQVLETLRKSGMEDNTVVIYTSDHGEGLADHHWTGKMMFYEGEAAVPLIVSWKGVTPAGQIDREHLVSTLDVLPTICDYAGVKPPPSLRGESLRPVIEKPEQPGHEFVASEMARGGGQGQRSFMVRTKRYKYMVFPGAQPPEMLFDLQSDPGEMKDLAGDASLEGELERHRQLLTQWKATTEEGKYPLPSKPKAKGRKAKRQGSGST
jgi:arylsulfatase A-like enzyme